MKAAKSGRAREAMGAIKKRVRLFGKCIPLVLRIVISLVVVSGATATILITEACEANPTPPYITTQGMVLSDTTPGKRFEKSEAECVSVATTTLDQAFYLTLRAVDPLYTRFKVVLTLASKPATSGLMEGVDNLTVEKGGSTRARMVLDAVGMYTFDETVSGIGDAGDGSIDTSIILTLEDE